MVLLEKQIKVVIRRSPEIECLWERVNQLRSKRQFLSGITLQEEEMEGNQVDEE